MEERPASQLSVPVAPAQNVKFDTPEPDEEMGAMLLDATNNSDKFVMEEMGRSLDQLVQSEEEADECYRRLVLQHDRSSSPLVMDAARASPRTVVNEISSVDSDNLARQLVHLSHGSEVDPRTPSSLGFSVSQTDSELKRLVMEQSLGNSSEILIVSIERDTLDIPVDQGVALNTSNFFADSGMSAREEVLFLEAEVAKLSSSLVSAGDLEDLDNMEPPLATSNSEVNTFHALVKKLLVQRRHRWKMEDF